MSGPPGGQDRAQFAQHGASILIERAGLKGGVSVGDEPCNFGLVRCAPVALHDVGSSRDLLC